MGRHKRPRGGQPGNQNARKHGLYAVNLTPKEICEYLNIINQGSLTPEMAVIRLKLGLVLRYSPGNPRLLREITRMLNKLCLDQNCFSYAERAELRKFMRDFKNAVIEKYTLPGPIEAES